MSVIVVPQTFQFVSFDAALIQRVGDTLLGALEMTDQTVTIEVDETTPLTRITVALDGDGDSDGITIRAQSGAFEDTRKLRHQSEANTATSLGRVLLRVRDRRRGGFGDAPADDHLSLTQLAAWETYCVGRLERLGVVANQQRWRYNFRNRHGFTDRSDAAFDRLWNSDGLTWSELDEISRSANDSTARV